MRKIMELQKQAFANHVFVLQVIPCTDDSNVEHQKLGHKRADVLRRVGALQNEGITKL